MKLGTLLLRNATISLSQLEAALRAQVLFGGKLGTNLVELGFVDLDVLSTYLGELTQLPIATREALDAVPKAALELVDAGTAARLGVVPLGVLPPPDDAVALAMIDASDRAAAEEVAVMTGKGVAPYVVPELRLLYYLEKLYGLPRKQRFVRTGTRRSAAMLEERRRAQPPGGIVMPPAVTVEPRARRKSAPPPSANVFASEEPTPLPRLAFNLAADRLDQATQREQIGDIFGDFCVGRFDALVVFLVRDGNALGWSGRVVGTTPRTPFDQISLPLGLASAFEQAHDGLRLFHGVPPSPGHPVENQLWEALGTPPPLEIVVAPVMVKARVVNLVYAHGLGGGKLPPDDVAELMELAGHASSAYVRLIQRKART